MSSFPVIGSIRNLNDVANALNRIRQYFVSQKQPDIPTLTPTETLKSVGITISPGKKLGVNASWELDNIVSGRTGYTVDPTRHLEIVIEGVRIKVAVLK